MTAPGPIRVLVADDHGVLRAAVRALIDAAPDMVLVGEAGDGRAAVAEAERLRPDVVVMDLTMPYMDGLTATRRLTARAPGVRVLVLTGNPEDESVLRVVDAGASGCILKQSTETDLLDAIRTVHRGEVYLHPSATRLVLEAYRRGEQTPPVQDLLSETEEAVLALTAEGYSRTEIGNRVFLSPQTIDHYRMRIMRKLGLHHRAELVRYALQHGLLRPQQDEAGQRL